MKHAIEYRPKPDAYRSTYGYGKFEVNKNLYLALGIVVTVGVILLWWAYQISKY